MPCTPISVLDGVSFSSDVSACSVSASAASYKPSEIHKMSPPYAEVEMRVLSDCRPGERRHSSVVFFATAARSSRLSPEYPRTHGHASLTYLSHLAVTLSQTPRPQNSQAASMAMSRNRNRERSRLVKVAHCSESSSFTHGKAVMHGYSHAFA